MEVTVKMERNNEGYFSCYVEDEENKLPFGLQGYGETAQEAKEDLLVGYEETKEYRKSKGLETPELTFNYQFDLQSFFNYFDCLNVSAFAKMAGVNETLMRRYSSGSAKASKKQYAKIDKAVKRLSMELHKAVL